MIAAALAGASAGTASAMALNGPGCTARAVTIVAPSGTCGFDSPTDWALVAIEPVGGTATATVRCTDQYGYVRTSSRTVAQHTIWNTSAYGSCSLTVAVGSATAATATAVPTIRIYTTP